jgi:hypothetical protein
LGQAQSQPSFIPRQGACCDQPITDGSTRHWTSTDHAVAAHSDADIEHLVQALAEIGLVKAA